jgi:class 3 adenylate cyclase
VVNLAARLCAMAPGGAILVTNRVHTAVEDRVTASSMGEHDLKGLSRPVLLYQIDGLR